jgi:hypothetical protein
VTTVKKHVKTMIGGCTYEERISSNRTETLFLVLTLLFIVLSVWRARGSGPDILTAIFFGLSVFFLFYSLNYRTLIIRLTPQDLKLRFGLFTWTIGMDDIENCYLDDASLWRIGGAGIHFSRIHGRYRAILNFLEYPRVVIVLKKKRGLVRDIAFSSEQPNQVIRLIHEGASTRNPA